MQTDLSALCERTLMAATAIARAAPIAWVVDASFQTPADTIDRTIVIALAPLSQRPDADDLIPDGCELLRSVVFPASQLADMLSETRERHRSHYRAFLMWNAAQAVGKDVADLQPWVDYDAVSIDDAVAAWARPALRRVA